MKGKNMYSQKLSARLNERLHVKYGIGKKTEEEQEKPTNYVLMQNYPKPFNPVTTIRYEIPKAGAYQVPFDGSKLSSGVYIYKLTAGENVISRKMILMR